MSMEMSTGLKMNGPAPIAASTAQKGRVQSGVSFMDVFDRSLKQQSGTKNSEKAGQKAEGKTELKQDVLREDPNAEQSEKADQDSSGKTAGQETEESEVEKRQDKSCVNPEAAAMSVWNPENPADMIMCPETSVFWGAGEINPVSAEFQNMIQGTALMLEESPKEETAYSREDVFAGILQEAGTAETVRAAQVPLSDGQTQGRRLSERTESEDQTDVWNRISGEAVLPVLEKAEADGTKTEDFFQASRNFRQSQEAVDGPGKAVSTPAEDSNANRLLEDLKRSADAKGLNAGVRTINAGWNIQAEGKTAQTAAEIPVPLTEQVKTGVEKGFREGLSEFTVRLKPEGLGSILVHLTSSDGRLAVRIGVSDPETGKLITNQMDALKDMLKPLHAEVEEVYQDSHGTMDFTGYQQEMYQRDGETRGMNHYTYSRRREEPDFDTEESLLAARTEQMTAESRIRRLYAYV